MYLPDLLKKYYSCTCLCVRESNNFVSTEIILLQGKVKGPKQSVSVWKFQKKIFVHLYKIIRLSTLKNYPNGMIKIWSS